MLFQTHSGATATYGNGFGYDRGLGAAALVPGADFKCVDKAGNPLPICFGIGAQNHQLLQQLQQTINAFSTERGFLPLVVDGFIGDKTVAAVATLGPVFAELGFRPSGTTKEVITRDAATLIEALRGAITRRLAAGHPVAAQGTPVAPTKAVTAAAGLPKSAATDVTAITTAPTAAAAAALPLPKSRLGWWIAGGLAAVAVVGGVGYVVYRRKARSF